MPVKSYSEANLVKLRKAENKLGEDDLPNRANMAHPKDRSKIPKFPETSNERFEIEGAKIYGKMRRAFFELVESAKILDDILFNYYLSDITGLMLRGRFGPHNFGDEKLGPNPYGLSMELCEREANQILTAMIPDPDSPCGIELQTLEQRDWPILYHGISLLILIKSFTRMKMRRSSLSIGIYFERLYSIVTFTFLSPYIG